MEETHRILAVDDDDNILTVLEARLMSAGYDVLTADCAEAALEILADVNVDLIVSDVKMPGMGGKGLLGEVARGWPHVPVILLTAYGNVPDAVETLKNGAADYMTKPFDGNELLERVKKVLDRRPADPPAPPELPLDGFWGVKSPAMKEFITKVERAAQADVSVLLLGESGTGKERIARLLHDGSDRAKGPFVPVDCGSTQPSLLESELFGHVKGAFTNAVKDKPGLMEAADAGTLFLDEIGNISPEMQTRLLRFLQERTLRRVGDTKERTVDCRVVAATNADIWDMVHDGSFRQDLYFRLRVVLLEIPPLRQRGEDLQELAERFVQMFCHKHGRPLVTISSKTYDKMRAHPWPGNVRELMHAIEGALVFCEGETLLPEHLDLTPVNGSMPEEPRSLSLEENEKRTIMRALEESGWVKKRAADLLGISRRAIHYKINKYEIADPK
ncbi:sigma-54-dependent transcriptional regulator [Salidesulfovibrio brasiliensis]|uniref:sigma-54-dependent transcriptional regulator n=1 Tax=Salidesulfovibrio brasiliensis TaxID=221711 RepID=UPI0006D1902B|nr:sigma-54 dependent transcriptional regulator [Salidesulfovibrio brasiliensis]